MAEPSVGKIFKTLDGSAYLSPYPPLVCSPFDAIVHDEKVFGATRISP